MQPSISASAAQFNEVEVTMDALNDGIERVENVGDTATEAQGASSEL